MDTATNHLARAQHLMNIHRFDAAIQELEQALVFDPENTEGLHYLSVARYNIEDYKGGLAVAQQLLGKMPDNPHSHYCAAINLEQLKRLDEAERHIREALSKDATDPDFYAVLSSIYMQRKMYDVALAFAETGLESDPEHIGCLNYRTACLTKLGRKDDTQKSVLETLAASPDNAYSHTNVGWSKLETGDHKAAKQHFAEALRLDPSLESARDGMLEALKANNFFYRYFLYYLFWMAKKTERNQWVVILGLYFGTQFIGRYTADYPFLTPVFYVLVAFAFLTWVTQPLFNLILRFDSVARHALNQDERNASTVVGVGIVGGISAFVPYCMGVQRADYWFCVAIFFWFSMIPVSRYFMTKEMDLRRKVGIYALVLLIIGGVSLVALPGLFKIFVYSFIGFQFVYNYWNSRS